MSFMSLASAGLRAGLDRMLEDGLTIPPGQEEVSLLNSSAVWDEQLDEVPYNPQSILAHLEMLLVVLYILAFQLALI